MASIWACEAPDIGDALGDAPPRGSQPVPDAGEPASGQEGGRTTPGAPAIPAFTCDPGKDGKTGDFTIKFEISGSERTVFVHVPKSYDPKKGVALVTAFHGYGGFALQMKLQTRFDDESDTRGFIVAYADGTGLAQKGFNAGDCCGMPAWGEEKVDDVGLGRAIVKKLTTDYCVDPKRVYNAGFSNGGFMSYRFACEASDVYAAVGSVSGVLGIPPETCKPERQVPIIHVHGTADPTVSYKGGGAAGGLGALVKINFRGVDETLDIFKAKNGCGEAKEIAKSGDTTCKGWTGCAGGGDLELCTVDGGGHQWPGGLPTPVGGKTSDFNASKALLDFFDAHPMK